MTATKGVRKYAMVVLMMAFMVSACHQKEVVKREIVHDTVFVDNPLKKVDTVFYDSKWLRNRFETAKWKKWRNYKDSIAVEYPEFMKYRGHAVDCGLR